MASTKKDSVDTTITNEEVVTTETKKAEAKAANAKATAANKEAAKKNAEATAAVVKDAAEKAADATKKAAKKAAGTTKKNVEKAVASTKKAVKDSSETTTKRKYTRKPTKNIVIQYLGDEISEEVLTERALAQFAATEGAVSVKSITLYIKPEDKAAYYVINDQYTGCVEF
ncbi:MAG: DUF6465 family protein [Clostridiales bacterium]|nr:DUF6465 family protein [Clostridiales bacterium]